MLCIFIVCSDPMLRWLLPDAVPFTLRTLYTAHLFNHTHTQMDHEAGGEVSKPATGPTGATTDALGAHAAPGSAASGMTTKRVCVFCVVWF